MHHLATARGELTIVPACSVALLDQLGIDDGLGFFWHNRPDRQLDALKKIAATPDGCVTIAHNGTMVVGYVTIGAPDPDVRWGRDQIKGLYELGGIEVSRNWRRAGIGEAVLAATFTDDSYAEAIVLATGYRWCWDFEGSGVNLRDYRDALHRLFRKFGFEFFDTDEPNIAWYPDNALVARIGTRASRELVAQFKALLFESVGSDYSLGEFVGR
ncbi:MAG: GNAT family N-acetyltransferase [Chloroflexi bacterium]|nr:GNAT family N-acetyltransferase [Chloroflexota bacterium]